MPPPSHSPNSRPAEDGASVDVDALFLIVVGAHPKAEMCDRPLAYRLRQVVEDTLAARYGPNPPLRAMVVSDVWYLNDPSLRACPAVSVGSPGQNAFSAYLGDKLPSAYVVDDRLMVQMDLDFTDLVACCWGVDAGTTAAAVEAFIAKYLDDFATVAGRRAG